MPTFFAFGISVASALSWLTGTNIGTTRSPVTSPTLSGLGTTA